MTFKTKIDSNYAGVFVLFTLIVGGLIASCFASFSVKAFIFTAILSAFYFILVIPMYINTNYTIEDDKLIIRYGYKTRNIPYPDIFAFQRVDQGVDLFYGLSGRRIAIFMHSEQGKKSDVIAVSPKDEEGFIRALTEKSGITITPPLPHYQDVFDMYRENTTEAQRFEARKRVVMALSKGYDGDKLNAESPQEFMDRQLRMRKEWAEKKEREARREQRLKELEAQRKAASKLKKWK